MFPQVFSLIAVFVVFLLSARVHGEILVLGDEATNKPPKHIWMDKDRKTLTERICQQNPQIMPGTDMAAAPCKRIDSAWNDFSFSKLSNDDAAYLDESTSTTKRLGLSPSLRARILLALKQLNSDPGTRATYFTEENAWLKVMTLENAFTGAINDLLSLISDPKFPQKREEASNVANNDIAILKLAQRQGVNIKDAEKKLDDRISALLASGDFQSQKQAFTSAIEDLMKSFEEAVANRSLRVVGKSESPKDGVISSNDPSMLAALAELIFRGQSIELSSATIPADDLAWYSLDMEHGGRMAFYLSENLKTAVFFVQYWRLDLPAKEYKHRTVIKSMPTTGHNQVTDLGRDIDALVPYRNLNFQRFPHIGGIGGQGMVSGSHHFSYKLACGSSILAWFNDDDLNPKIYFWLMRD